MSERIEELKGRLKEGTGRLTGNKRLEAEGKGQAERARAERKTRGVLRETGGTLKENVGALTGDEATEAEGHAQRVLGETERAG